jgi:hypothetical protein
MINKLTKPVQMFIAPVESDLQHGVEVRQGRGTTYEQTAPDERTDLSQDDTQLIANPSCSLQDS